jgi:hypothetical protein
MADRHGGSPAAPTARHATATIICNTAVGNDPADSGKVLAQAPSATELVLTAHDCDGEIRLQQHVCMAYAKRVLVYATQ